MRTILTSLVPRALGLALLVGCTAPTNDPTASVPDKPRAETKYLEYNRGAGDSASADAYYHKIGAPQDFADWKTQHCFKGNEVQLEYFNQADLALGRHVYMARCNVTDVAAYIENHGAAGQPSTAGLQALGTEATAVVAMDYSPGHGLGRDVQFYIYIGGKLAPSVWLDWDKPKFAPHACTACHGGDPEQGRVTNARFLPFLRESIIPLHYDLATEEALRGLNELVYDTLPADMPENAGIKQLLNAAYPNGYDPPEVYHVDAVPDAWASQSDLYKGFILRYCVTCHAAQLSHLFDLPPSDWGAVKAHVCDAKDMPNSQEGQIRFDGNAEKLWCNGGIP